MSEEGSVVKCYNLIMYRAFHNVLRDYKDL